MLDLDHPQTQHIFEASALEDALMVRAQKMSVLPSAQRLPLLAQCHFGLDALRRLNRDHFGADAFTNQAIEEAESALDEIAHAGRGRISEDHSNGEGNCAVCGATIAKCEFDSGPNRHSIVSCDVCTAPFMKAKAKLESPAGFFTCAI